jgi:hypothetical protein
MGFRAWCRQGHGGAERAHLPGPQQVEGARALSLQQPLLPMTPSSPTGTSDRCNPHTVSRPRRRRHEYRSGPRVQGCVSLDLGRAPSLVPPKLRGRVSCWRPPDRRRARGHDPYRTFPPFAPCRLRGRPAGVCSRNRSPCHPSRVADPFRPGVCLLRPRRLQRPRPGTASTRHLQRVSKHGSIASPIWAVGSLPGHAQSVRTGTSVSVA